MQFFSECIKEVKGEKTEKKDVYSAYARFCKERHYISKSHLVFSKRCKANGYGDDTVRMGKPVRVWLDIVIIGDGTDEPESTRNIDDFGDDKGSPDETKKGKPKNKKGTGSDAKPEQDGYRYCTTCDAGPWEVGNSKTGMDMVDYHVDLEHDVVECNERGAVKE